MGKAKKPERESISGTKRPVSAGGVAKLDDDLSSSADNLTVTMETVRQTTKDIQTAVTQLTAQDSVIGTLSSPEISASLETTVKNLEEISKNLLTVTKDTQKIVEGVRGIFETK